MKEIVVSGLINVETTVRVRGFPIPYYPIDYPFFGVDTGVSGVAYNVARALRTLGDRVRFHSMVGKDFQAEYIYRELSAAGVDTTPIRASLGQTPSSVILYDEQGRRQVYCDLKDIQDARYGFDESTCRDADLVVACNINFNRPLLSAAKAAGKTIATDVHVLGDIQDDYNRDFMANADILFLSDEAAPQDFAGFLRRLGAQYGNAVIVMGRGSQGAAMYLGETGTVITMPAVRVGEIRNTVGAGDALFSAFVHYHTQGESPVEALVRAQLFASAKITATGGARGLIAPEALEELYTQHAEAMKNGIQVLH